MGNECFASARRKQEGADDTARGFQGEEEGTSERGRERRGHSAVAYGLGKRARMYTHA